MADRPQAGQRSWEGEMFRLLVENVRDYAIFVVDAEGRVQTWSAGAERLLGYREGEIVGQPEDRFFTPEDVAGGVPRQERQQALETGRGEDERWHIRKDGSRFWSSGVMMPLRDEGGTLQGFAKIMRDRTDLKRAEGALNDALAFAESVVATVREPLVVLDGDLRVRTANRSFYQTFRVGKEETEGRLLYDLGKRQWDIPALRKLLEEILPQNTAFDGFEVAHEFPGIGPKVMLLNARRLYREASHTPLILLAVEDITERRRAEDERREVETRFTSLVKNIRDHSIFTLDPGGRITSWNVEAGRILGYAEAEALGQHFSVIFTPEDVRRGLPEWELRTALEQGRAEDERWHVRKGGEWFWALGIVTPTHDTSGRHTGYSKILRDMTDRKRAEDAVRESEAQLRLVADHAPVLIAHCDRQRRFRFVNRANAERFGLTPTGVVGRHVAEVMGPEAYEAIRPYVDRALAGETVEYEAEVPYRGLGRRFMRCAYVPQRSAAGAVEGWVAVVADITDRREADERLRAGELRFRTLTGLAPVGIFQTDAEGNCLFVNEKWCQLAGMSPEAARGRGWAAALHPEDRGRVFHEWYTAAQAGREFACEYRFRTPEGKVSWLQGSAVALRNDTGEVTGHIGTVTDITGRREVEEQVRFQAHLLDAVGQAAVVTDPEGRIIYWNRFAETLYGWPIGEVLGRNVLEVTVAPAVVEQAAEVMGRLRAGQSWSGEFLVRRRDGTTFPAAVTDTPVFDGRGRLEAVIGISTDITERKRVEEALRQSEARFRGLMEQAPFSVQVFTPDGKTIRVNRAWEELWGVRFEQIAGYNILEDRQLEARGVLHYIHQGFAGQPARIPAIQYNPNDTIPDITQQEDPRRWLAAVIYPLKDAEGRVREVVLIHEDITARHRAEQALVEAHRDLEDRVTQRTAELVRANEFMKALLENVQTGIVACDAAGVLNLFNNVTRDLHGLPEEPLPPEQWAGRYRLYLPDGHTPMAKEDVPLYRALQGERVRDAEMVIAPAGVPPRTVLTSGQAFYDAQGVKLGAVVSMHDITQRKLAEEGLRRAKEELERRVEERTLELARANESLRDADRRKDEFLATLAHELRNPLAPLRNSLQILKMPRVEAAMAQQTREMMERQVHHLVRLVDDLLDVSRVMRGKIELRREPMELATVVARAVETVQPLIEVQGHRLDLALPPESLLLDADPVRLAQVVGNLLTNAAKYTEAEGRIWLSAQREGGTATLRVRDNGIGIAPDVLPHVFELFVQVDHAATRSQGGLGIGLTLVKNLVEMHGGTVEAHSEGLGEGCEFVVRLPLMAQDRREPDDIPNGDPRQDTPRASGHRLLVVDDNKDAAVSLAMLLRLQGHEVRVAHDGPSALELATSYRPGMVFLDIGMPGMDGYEVARRMRRTPGLENTFLAALTGWGQQEDRRRSAEAGFDHHLVKPPEPKALESLLAELKPPKG